MMKIRLPLIVQGKRVRLWPLLLPMVLLIPGLFGFPYPSSEALYSDLTITHYPYALFLKRTLYNHGVIPLWSPLILSGHPFIANPLSGIWYPPGWLAILLPLPVGFNILIALHLLWGVVGMYYMLRSEQVSHEAAILGGLAFGFLPKLFAHYGAGHLTLLYAVPWTPWLMLTSRHGKRKWFWPGIILAIIVSADVRWTVYSVTLLWIYWLFLGIESSDKEKSRASDSHRNNSNQVMGLSHILKNSVKRLRNSTLRLLLQTIMAVCIAAPLLLPFYEFVSFSTRAHLSPQELLINSLPPTRLLGLFFPDFGGYHEWALYPGAVVLVLCFISVSKLGRSRYKYFWILVSILSLIFSLGSNAPVVPMITKLPGFNLLRVPPRALFLFGIATCALAAHSINGLLVEAPNSKSIRRVILILTALMAFASAITLGIWVLTGDLPLNFPYGTLFLIAVSIWIIFYLHERITQQVWFIGILILGVFDWSFVDISSYSSRSKKQVLSEEIRVVQFLSRQEGFFRVYSPSYSVPQQMSALYGLGLADGVDPLQLRSYAEFMEAATGVPSLNYSVTMPPFEQGDPTKDNRSYQPDPSKLGLLNVKYITSEFDLSAKGLVFIDQVGDTRIYENTEVLPRSWVQPLNEEVGEEAITAKVLEWTPRMIRIQAHGPGLLVLSELAYPRWDVYVDGDKSEIIIVEDLLRGVMLASGAHEVKFSYTPIRVYLGLAISASVLTISIIALVWMDRSAKKNQ